MTLLLTIIKIVGFGVAVCIILISVLLLYIFWGHIFLGRILCMVGLHAHGSPWSQVAKSERSLPYAHRSVCKRDRCRHRWG